MDVFELRNAVIADYSAYVRSFLTIRDERIKTLVEQELTGGFLWPEPLIQLNPAFEPGDTLEALVAASHLHRECLKVFSAKDVDGTIGKPLQLHRHQVESIHAARAGDNYVLTTGTGSGKSLSYIVPIVDHVLRRGSGKGIQAIVVYPMNALANSQVGELEKFLCRGYPKDHPPVTFKRYTGQEDDEERNAIIANPPDILLTNYVMLELVLTRPWEHELIRAAEGLRFLVLDELHTYRGRQGADVAALVRRLRNACKATSLQHVGTSATLASVGSWEEQRRAVAEVATELFGAPIKPERVIGETLRRQTVHHDLADAKLMAELATAINKGTYPKGGETREILSHPLASWIESNLGIRPEPVSGRLIRCAPMPLTGSEGAAKKLADATGCAEELCEQALRQVLMAGYHSRDDHDRPVFAFRLHQFISKGESVYASPESEETRHVTLQAQQFVPNSDRQRVLLPVVFCRECGQEYYLVRRGPAETGGVQFAGRDLGERVDTDDGEPGFLYVDSKNPWPAPGEDLLKRLPDSWIEVDDEGKPTVIKARREYLPREVFISPQGIEGGGKLRAHYIAAPFRFCLQCGVTYSAHQQSDFGKLATLGSEGRSTATTITSLSIIRRLRHDSDLEETARKLLSFTDNRQDASLQAGHFNDFVEIGLLRASLLNAVRSAGAEGLRHDTLTRKVFGALALPLDLYAINPEVEYSQLEETEKALRAVLGYYLYRDLRRGWRITSPNLEQCGLLQIDYASLDRFCADDAKWKDAKRNFHPVLANATPAERERVCRVLLDYMRRELAIRVDYLEGEFQETLRQQSSQYLVPPWALDDQDRLERSRIIVPRSRGDDAAKGDRFVFLSPRGGFGLFLRRTDTFITNSLKLSVDDTQTIITNLLDALCIPGLAELVVKPDRDDGPGYQLRASGLIWKAGDGSKAFHDPVRVPNVPSAGLRTNRFFIDFYGADTNDLKRLEAREHTAQVAGETREDRERRFRSAELPILFCSPTMELGVDIASLNVVGLRNIPPTPANYAQRSGRAGRSGQPAFVLAYCSAGSPHDQFFFKHPEKMVAGAVSTPRLDLANEDLVRAHVHAIWLTEASLSLGKNLTEVLDVNGDAPTLKVLPKVQEKLDDQLVRQRAFHRAKEALGTVVKELVGPEGTVEHWLQNVLDQVPHSFNEACERWRGLYQAALAQSKRQGRVILDASKTGKDHEHAKYLRQEAEAQLSLLRDTGSEFQSDFYSYRYFASEGFLPGYNFPRLPLSAYLPGRRRRVITDEFLNRPRFVAISEFGPRSFVYHEGSRYVINKVILPVDADGKGVEQRASQCLACGYVHPAADGPGQDLCEHCGEKLPTAMDNLFRMQNVSARRRDRINSDEEERFRLGYELKTGLRFADRDGQVRAQTAEVRGQDGSLLAKLTYGHAASIWRLNMGWRRRQKKDQPGYLLDLERGYWSRNQAVDDDPEDPISTLVKRVVPYVDDHRNCLILEPAQGLDQKAMASLQAAIKAAIQVYFQVEDRELACEPLPSDANRRFILLYEASEGGAGVLRRLVEDPAVLPDIVKQALEICHFDPNTMKDERRAAHAREDCEAACYDCLLSYYNQRDHQFLDRKLLADILAPWRNAKVVASPTALPRDVQVQRLRNLTQSDLERRWLDLVDREHLKLPSDAQIVVDSCSVRPDFLYRSEGVAVFVDGPHHDQAAQQAIDKKQRSALQDAGFCIVAFHHKADWLAVFDKYPTVFGKRNGSESKS